MLNYLRYRSGDDWNNFAKHFQYRYFYNLWNDDYLGIMPPAGTGTVAEIGGGNRLETLRKCPVATKCLIDPFDGSGGGVTELPNNIPGPHYRCTVGGDDSQMLPDDLLDLSFSSSVLEHIGGRIGWGLEPIPEGHHLVERLNVANFKFWRDLLRVTKAGGTTVHTVDAGARSVPFCYDVAIEAGWEPVEGGLDRENIIETMVNDKSAVRQQNLWRHGQVLPTEGQEKADFDLQLSNATVLIVALRKP